MKDGIIDEKKFERASPKILFIEKEPNNKEQTPGDFREWWKEELAYPFSYRIAEWSSGILNDFPTIDDIWKNWSKHQREIERISFLNVKKIGGGGSSNIEEIQQHIAMNYNFLIEEIKIINPSIIILGLSYVNLRDALFKNMNWKDSGYGIKIGKYGRAKIIDFYHPSSRNAPAASYCLLQNVIQGDAFKSL